MELSYTPDHSTISQLLGPLFVYKLKDEIILISTLKQDTSNLEQRPAQVRRATLGDTAGLGIKCAGLERWSIHPRKGHQCALVGEPAYITDVCHKLRAGNFTCCLLSR